VGFPFNDHFLSLDVEHKMSLKQTMGNKTYRFKFIGFYRILWAHQRVNLGAQELTDYDFILKIKCILHGNKFFISLYTMNDHKNPSHVFLKDYSAYLPLGGEKLKNTFFACLTIGLQLLFQTVLINCHGI
jgi:hypothetical protein